MNEYDLFKCLLHDDMLDINALLIKNYKKLSINEKDIILLSSLARSELKGSTYFKPSFFKEKVGLTQDEFYTSLSQLSEKGYIVIKTGVNPKTGKECESFSLDNLYKAICDIYIAAKLKNIEKSNLTFQEDISLFYETNYKKQLSPSDIEIIKNWAEDKLFTIDQIKKEMLDNLKMGKTSLRSVDQSLIQKKTLEDKNPEYEEIDDVIKRLREKWKK